MDKRIIVLALANFAMGTEAFVYAGHLGTLAIDLSVSIPVAGQLAAAFAVTLAVTGPVVAGLAARFDRRTVIASGLVLIGLLNLLAAFQESFVGLVAVRILCGIGAGLVGPISSVAATEPVPPEMRGKAMAAMLGGVTLAFILGVPAGSIIGDYAGWRGTFVFAGVVALAVAVPTLLILPRLPGSVGNQVFTLGDVTDPRVWPSFAMTFVGFAAAFTIVAYIGPLATAIAGLSGSGIGFVQALIGVGSIGGIVLGGRMAGKAAEHRVLVFSFLVAIATALSYALLLGLPFTAAALGYDAPVPPVVTGVMVASLVLGAASLFARIPILQTRLANATRQEARPVVFAIAGSLVSFGQGLGAGIGGLAISIGGLAAIGIAAAIVAAVGLMIAAYGAWRTRH
jgi:predicted MFS family arabinose efflux permease